MGEQGQGKPRWIAGVEPSKELLAANGTQILEIECREQPKRLRDLILAYRTDPSLRAELKKFRELAAKPDPILFIGMGASYCSSFGGSILLQTHGRLAFSVDAGEWLHYGRPVWSDPVLSVLLTTSGESAELVELFKSESESKLGLICNNPESTCWKLAKNKLPILAGPEYGNATKTYTNATAASIILASEMLSLPWEDDAERTADAFEANLDPIFAQRSELEAFCRGAANIEIVGRGAAYGGAFMSALCIREMSGYRAAPHTGAGFKHGPNLDVDASHVAIIFALGRAADLGVKLAAECNRRGGKVVLVANEDHPATDKLFPMRIDAVPEPWEGITSLLVPQALTLGMVERTGCRLPPRFQYGVMEQ
ncbi:glucosamine--fructose-6-phosphate aminotransferase (isomerizing) [Silvibacterium bohemicum]|uniref:Glutamine--fructose-6-phosphate aminotransferase [isomerizing] n=1 Tax=Silvibacterium bohemicum TaxID=1577686 RepID=A0A841JQJ0_9BACT|nr:SIS domain-containing protein [Silvibacterium bohemicum]MBB6143596.1 glucosamine--fructose-6-phosphate aminotransferase (isomerizing) [Silvibacterium bohemicum]